MSVDLSASPSVAPSVSSLDSTKEDEEHVVEGGEDASQTISAREKRDTANVRNMKCRERRHLHLSSE
jgi:hypothetical protein